MRVASLHVHPLKGGTIADRERVDLAPAGVAGDRRWMVVDGEHRFVSQRTLPALARLALDEVGGRPRLALDGASHEGAPDGGRAEVVVWGDTVSAATVDAETDRTLSDWLGRPVRLVRFDGASERMTDREWADAPVAFADGFPILVVLSASLDALNDRIAAKGGEPVPMARFRPNIVIEGAPAWGDDGWRAIRVGGVTLDLVKPCARCKVTTVDQASGEIFGHEPLATLREMRMSGERSVPGVLFGWNAVAWEAATVSVGDAVEVVERRDPWPIRGRERPTAPAF